MYIAKYLLSIEEFMDTEKGEALLERASLCVDEERRRKAEHMRTRFGQAACLGAGLLLQFAVEEALGGGDRFGSAGVAEGCGRIAGDDVHGGCGRVAGDDVHGGCGRIAGDDVHGGCGRVAGDDAHADRGRVAGNDVHGGCGGLTGDDVIADCGGSAGGVHADCRELPVDDIAVTCRGLKICSVTGVLDDRKDASVRQFTYRYGVQGKPYFRNLPFYFNLSHSGSYVLCGLSMAEIGADIQQHCGKDVGKLGRRFYSKRESAALEQAGAEREKLFYRLWARKEAYGKLTGEGIGKALGVDLLPGMVRTYEGEIYDTVLCDSRIPIFETVSLPRGRRLVWEEWDSVEGYSIALCRYG